jgi:hypothetical protein
MSKSFTDLLRSTAGSDEALKTKLLPPARFIAQIVSGPDTPNILPRFWKANKDKPDRAAQCYSATFKLVDYFPTGDDDTDQYALERLEAFGDWRGKKLSSNGRIVIEPLGPEKRLAVMGIGPGSFALIDTSPDFEQSLGWSSELTRFARADDNNRITGGFVTLLSKEPTVMVPLDIPPVPVEEDEFRSWLMNLIAATEGTYCVLEVGVRKYTRPGSTGEEEFQDLVSVSSVA